MCGDQFLETTVWFPSLQRMFTVTKKKVKGFYDWIRISWAGRGPQGSPLMNNPKRNVQKARWRMLPWLGGRRQPTSNPVPQAPRTQWNSSGSIPHRKFHLSRATCMRRRRKRTRRPFPFLLTSWGSAVMLHPCSSILRGHFSSHLLSPTLLGLNSVLKLVPQPLGYLSIILACRNCRKHPQH